MRTILSLSGLLVMLTQPLTTIGCVDYHPPTVNVEVSMDINCNVEVRVLDLNIFGGAPGAFCSCAIINNYQFLEYEFQLDYVVFVDSETNIPLEGFEPFNYDPNASISWSEVDPDDYDWAGFVAAVSSEGLQAGQIVDLVVRGHFVDVPNCTEAYNYYYEIPEELIEEGGFGTDEWNNETNELALSHNSITYFDGNLQFITVESDYFEFLDNLVPTAIAENATMESTIYLSASSGLLTVMMAEQVESIEVYSIAGSLIILPMTVTDDRILVATESLSGGTYVLIVNYQTGASSYQFIKL
jgi:hypothetical protein